ncbi:MAG: DUF2284 domain-containing protein [Desulfobacterales bacterium]|nr:DUF2284 domain-containing protein [Desulfobacterales bacterium]
MSYESVKELEELFKKHGFEDFKWIEPKEIIVSQWVRMKCTFGCGDYGKNASCPPNTPPVSECERFFREYSNAVIFHFEKKVDVPEDRHKWSKKINSDLLKLEREVFLSGYERTFLLFMDGCSLCTECSEQRADCKNPKMSRPVVEAMAVDVYTTVRKVGYPIQVRTDYSQEMNRYALLMIH